jgi:hypothetical protein
MILYRDVDRTRVLASTCMWVVTQWYVGRISSATIENLIFISIVKQYIFRALLVCMWVVTQ